MPRQTIRRRKHIRSKHIRSKHKKGGMFKASKPEKISNAEDILLTIPIYSNPDKDRIGVLNRKSPLDLMEWIGRDMNDTAGLSKDMYKDNDVLGTGKLSAKYIDKYKSISDIWGYNSTPYINYELLTHSDYNGQPLIVFQGITDPLMRNLQKLSDSKALIMPGDTITLIRRVYGSLELVDSNLEYVNWFCSTVLTHFIQQANLSTLLYELAARKWVSSNPDFNDENVLLFLSLTARLFLLLAVKEWDRMRDLLKFVGI